LDLNLIQGWLAVCSLFAIDDQDYFRFHSTRSGTMRLFHDLLMFHGYVTEPRLLRELAGTPEADASASGAPAAIGTDVGPTDGQPGETRPAVAGFGRGVVTLCAAALSAFR
jgi:hypothetical protein